MDLALAISLASAIFTGCSLVYVSRTFRRNGARIKTTLHADMNNWQMTGPRRPYLSVTAGNSGLASVQATRLVFEVKGEDVPLRPKAYMKGTVPTVIGGLTETVWVIVPDTLTTASKKQVRAVVHLAGLKPAKSQWVTID